MSILEYNYGEDSLIYDLKHYSTILVGRHTGGRKPDICIPKQFRFVSRVQCGIALQSYESGDKWIIKDGSLITLKNSSFGTFVDGIRLGNYEIRKLESGNIITFAGQYCPYIKFICEGNCCDQIKEEHFTSSHDFNERYLE